MFSLGLVGIRLICPFSFRSVFSLIPSSETIPYNIGVQQEPAIDTGIIIVNETVNPIIGETFAPIPEASANPLQLLISVTAVVWCVGMIVFLIYTLISFFRLKRMVMVSVSAGDHIIASDEVKAPFILGVMNPRICIPSGADSKTLEYVIQHEKAHLERYDYLWKPLGFLLLTVHWFNPLCWIAYILFCKDIEMACDESVIRNMSKDDVAAYVQALLDYSNPWNKISACPVAFAETGVKDRIKGVLNYRKPSFRIILVTAIVFIAVIICLMTDPFSSGSVSGKLAESMEKAIAERYHVTRTDWRYDATDYYVLRVSRDKDTTTVYCWVLYEEYVYEGCSPKYESGSRIPTVITFDTSGTDSDQSAYRVIEYWEPRDGNYYKEDRFFTEFCSSKVEG